jgi:hypothetical protein
MIGTAAVDRKPSMTTRPRPDRVWNRIPDAVHQQIIKLALDEPALSPRELAVGFTDMENYFVSEASVRRRRDVAIEAGSTTWLSIPSASPASWMTTSGKISPVRARAFSLSCPKRSISPATSPPRTECFDNFSPPPGDSDVINQVDRLSSNETKIAPRSVRIAVGASGQSTGTCIVASRVGG